MKQKIKLLYIDLFCGAGGTSTGVENARLNGEKCAKVIACVNHDPNAIASHAANHPNALHFTEDIRTLELSPLIAHVQRMRLLHPDAHIVLWASLECTNFSKAKGGQPRDADSRTLAEHLFRYIEAIDPDFIHIENVEEFMSWGDMDEHGRPISKDNGRLYVRWTNKVCNYGYHYDWRILNAADFGAYTSRRRYFGQFSRHGLPIAFPAATHAKNGDNSALFKGVYKKWKPVREVLDLNDEVQKWIESIYSDLSHEHQMEAEAFFPELAESDGEKIRKELMDFIYVTCFPVKDLKKKERFLTWLEKQGEKLPVGFYYVNSEGKKFYSDTFNYGDVTLHVEKQEEQKPADNVEPKFHEGEWLCENEPNNYARFIQILEIVNVQGKERYRISRDIHNDEDIVEFDFVEKYYHKFDIKDAKAGDVLVDEDVNVIGIFECIKGMCWHSKIYYSSLTKKLYGIECGGSHQKEFAKPATKEQRDTLMKVIADVGYTFDFEKKELKKIEQDSTEFGENRSKELSLSLQIQSYLNTASDELYAKGKPLYSEERLEEIHECMSMWAKLHHAYFYRKPAWSEKDESHYQMLQKIICESDITASLADKLSDWLKSIKQRIGG